MLQWSLPLSGCRGQKCSAEQRFSWLFLHRPHLSSPNRASPGAGKQRATQTQARQPAWPPPLITAYVGLIQVARADFIRQTASNLTETWNLDGGKGLNLIPFANTELDINLPPYFEHSAPLSPTARAICRSC